MRLIFADVVLRFAIRRHRLPVLVDGAGSRVVGGERQRFVVAVPIQQLSKIADAGADVLRGVERRS